MSGMVSSQYVITIRSLELLLFKEINDDDLFTNEDGSIDASLMWQYLMPEWKLKTGYHYFSRLDLLEYLKCNNFDDTVMYPVTLRVIYALLNLMAAGELPTSFICLINR